MAHPPLRDESAPLMLERLYRFRCPSCGEPLEVLVEADVYGELVQDCEVCCRPLRLLVPRDDGHGADLRVEALES